MGVLFAVLFQLEPSSFAFRTFSAKRNSQRRALSASMTITTTFVSVCAGSNIWRKEVMYSDHYSAKHAKYP
jgi:hypothetical protein